MSAVANTNHDGPATLVFYAGLSALIVHEMDAVMGAEWRLLFGLRSLPDDQAYPIFLALHFPLTIVLLWLTHHRRTAIRRGSRAVVAAFLIIHTGLHIALEDHPSYGFHSALSEFFIIGAGVLGFAYFWLARMGSMRQGEP